MQRLQKYVISNHIYLPIKVDQFSCKTIWLIWRNQHEHSKSAIAVVLPWIGVKVDKLLSQNFWIFRGPIKTVNYAVKSNATVAIDKSLNFGANNGNSVVYLIAAGFICTRCGTPAAGAAACKYRSSCIRPTFYKARTAVGLVKNQQTVVKTYRASVKKETKQNAW